MYSNMAKSIIRLVLLAIATSSLVSICLCGGYPARAATQTVNVFPNYDTSIGSWNNRSGGDNYWGRIHRQYDKDYDSSWICSSSNNSVAVFGAGATESPGASPAPMPNVQQGVTSISASVYGKSSYKFLDFTHPDVKLEVLVQGSVLGVSTETWPDNAGIGGVYNCNQARFGEWRDTTIGAVDAISGNEWTQDQVDTLQFRLSRSKNTTRSVRIMSMRGSLSYVTYSTLTQNGYRFYQNANSLTPGAVLGASASTPIDINRDTDSANFRLRMAVQTTNERWLRQYGSYKLQYALKGAGTCASPTGSWSDVQAGSGKVRWYTNPGAANGAAIANAVDQPAGTMTPQRYQSANPFSKQQQVTVNNFGIWDFSLQHVGTDYGDTFCFRVVNSDNNTQPLSGYTNYPELQITGNLSLDIVDSSGASVPSPKVNFPSMYTVASCQQSVGTLGTNGERIRVTDNRVSGNWSLSIAATGGASAKWQSGANNYSFNDSSGSPAGCANGQLGVSFGSINVAPKSGCTANGLSAESNANFSGATPISIGQGNGADRFCYWDITNVELNQQIPGSMSPGSYKLDMTLTVMSS